MWVTGAWTCPPWPAPSLGPGENGATKAGSGAVELGRSAFQSRWEEKTHFLRPMMPICIPETLGRNSEGAGLKVALGVRHAAFHRKRETTQGPCLCVRTRARTLASEQETKPEKTRRNVDCVVLAARHSSSSGPPRISGIQPVLQMRISRAERGYETCPK